MDGIDYVLNPGDGYATTQVYSLGDDGRVEHVLDTQGWATRFVAPESITKAADGGR